MSKGVATITITVPQNVTITSYNISPKKLAIRAKQSGNHLTFTLTKDEYLIVKINDLKELVVAADAAEFNVPHSYGKGIFNVSGPAYRADHTGRTLTTKALQKAINDASAYKNGVVYVPAGVYKIGNLQLKSNSSLYLEGGAVLLFSGNPADYTFSARKASQNRNLTWWIYTDSGAHDIKIYGRGTLDGNGKYRWPHHPRLRGLGSYPYALIKHRISQLQNLQPV